MYVTGVNPCKIISKNKKKHININIKEYAINRILKFFWDCRPSKALTNSSRQENMWPQNYWDDEVWHRAHIKLQRKNCGSYFLPNNSKKYGEMKENHNIKRFVKLLRHLASDTSGASGRAPFTIVIKNPSGAKTALRFTKSIMGDFQILRCNFPAGVEICSNPSRNDQTVACLGSFQKSMVQAKQKKILV